MKKFIYVILVTLWIMVPFVSAQGNADQEIAKTQGYIEAATKTGAAKISALQDYIKKFPDTKSKWTKLAYYQLAVGNFETRNYAEAMNYANQTLKIGAPGDGEEGRLYLIIANCLGIKGTSMFNTDKAMEMANKAVDFAESKGLDDVAAEAKSLRAKLVGTPKKTMTPEQQIKFHYANGAYNDAIAYYKTLSAADKANDEIYKTYANSLFKADKLDVALKEYEGLYAKEKKATYAARIGEIYSLQSKKNKALVDKAIAIYLEASLLYTREGNSANSKASYGKAEYMVYDKYGFNKKIEEYNKTINAGASSAKKNEGEIRKLEKELRTFERYLYKNYESQDLDPPAFEKDKRKKIVDKITLLKSGGSAKTTDQGSKLEEERKRITAEISALVDAAKKRLGM